MILVRQVFQTQIGKAKDVATMIMQHTAQLRRIAGPDVHGRVLTDISGPFGTVVLEIEIASLAEWERVQSMMSSTPKGEQESKSEAPALSAGYQEFYTLEGTF